MPARARSRRSRPPTGRRRTGCARRFRSRRGRAAPPISAELARTEERLAAQGRAAEAEIIGANRLMAEDPSLVRDVEVLATALPPAEALRTVTERHANALASLDDALLAARAADVRELGRRAVRALSGG